MGGPQCARTIFWEGDNEKRNAETEKVPAFVTFKSKKLLWMAFAFIFCNRLFLLLVDGLVLSLIPKLMSDFSESAHSFLSVLPTVIGISSGILRLPMAKIIDRHPRGLGFSLASLVATIGLMILPFASSLTALVVAQIFYGIGSGCMDFVLTVILADLTSLKNRALIYGIYVTPVIFTTLAAPGIAQSLESWIKWQGVFGICCIIWTTFTVPLDIMLWITHPKPWDKDEQGGSTITTEEKPRFLERQRRLLVDLDIPGIILAIAGISLLLLVPAHYPYNQEGWSMGVLSALLILGGFSMIFLFIWEYSLAPATFPASFIRDMNFVGGCGVAILTAGSIAYWSSSSYLSSYLQVVEDQTAIAADRVAATRILAFASSAPLIGLLIQRTGNYKYPAVAAGTCLLLTSIFHFTFHRKWAWACFQICVGITESVLMLCSQMAIMASVDHKDIAMALGTWGMFLALAVAINSTVATAIWTNSLPNVLKTALPSDSKNLIRELLSSLEKQQQYPIGSPIRDALVAAYGVAQQYLLCTAMCMATLAFAFVFLLKNINLRERRDVQGARARGVVW